MFCFFPYFQTHEEVVKDLPLLDDLLCQFFLQYRTTNRKTKKRQLPRGNTVDAVKSHLKNHMRRNNNKLDISIEPDFPKFSIFWKGYRKELKSKGLADTLHNKALPKEHLVKINELLVVLHQIMIGQPFLIDESQEIPVKTRNPKFDELLNKIPKTLNEKTGN